MSNVSKEVVLSCKTWLLIGIVCNVLQMIPSLNSTMFIPAIICTIIGMNKVVKHLSGIEDDEVQKFFRGTKLLRLNYIICVVVTIAVVFGLIIFGIVEASSAQNATSEEIVAEAVATLFTGGSLFVLGAVSVYYYGILIWALVHWIKLIRFLRIV